ncbi:MAG: DNA primase [Alphaproteobacteria bacterium]|nr:DNA primase [Alphaproteobacteria bacterium]
MRFDERFLDELKSRLRLSEVIGKRVQLRRQGREYVGLSPFNKERSPSFFVNDDKGFYHDFSSGKHGDLISFLQETEGLSFTEAVERLAGEAGMALPVSSPEAEARGKRRQGLADWLDLAAAWFEGELRRPAGREASAYLERRGLPAAEWGRFRLGYAPAGRTALKDYLIAKGASVPDLIAAGLLIAPDDGGAPYDRFRDRVIFPIADGRGRILSFGGRALNPEARAKYLNGPETDLFDKGSVLYGLAEARKLLREGGEGALLVVVEGYMDVIACQRAGVAAVAAMGTGLTEVQMDQLWRLHAEPILCFDADRAGRAAAHRAMDRALPRLAPGRSFRFAALQGGKDPDELVRAQGAGALKAQLAAAIPFVEALFARERDAEPLDTPERQAGLKRRLRQAAETIADRDLAQTYRQALTARLDALLAPATPMGGSQPGRRGGASSRAFRPGPGPAGADSKAAARRLSRAPDPVASALAIQVLADPALAEAHLEEIQTQGFGDPALDALAQEIVKEIIRLRSEGEDLDSGRLKRHLAECGFDALLIDAHAAATKSGAPFLQDAVDIIVARSQWSNGFLAVSRVRALDAAVALAKQGLVEPEQVRAFVALKQERDALRRAIAARSLWSDEDEPERARAPFGGASEGGRAV